MRGESSARGPGRWGAGSRAPWISARIKGGGGCALQRSPGSGLMRQESADLAREKAFPPTLSLSPPFILALFQETSMSAITVAARGGQG